MRTLLIQALLSVSFCCAGITRSPAQIQDPVTFKVKDYGCDLTTPGRPLGHLSPDNPLTASFARGREYLIECTSLDIGVKLYARHFLYSPAGFNGALPSEFDVVPVAVLPNLVKAAAANRIVVTAVTNAQNLECKEEKADPKEPWRDTSTQVVPPNRITVPNGTVPTVLADRPMHCGDTNLILIDYGGRKAWFRNRDFIFTFKGKPIGVFPPSRDYPCCWIE